MRRPWKEPMRVEEGDFLALQYPEVNGEVYRIECLAFGNSYVDDSLDSPTGLLSSSSSLMIKTFVAACTVAIAVQAYFVSSSNSNNSS